MAYLFLLLQKFLSAFAKLRQATIIFVTSVRPSAWNNSAPTGRMFMKFYIKGFRKSFEKIQVSVVFVRFLQVKTAVALILY